MNYGICFLAHGDEHINEFNIVAESLLKLNKDFKIFVGTDSVSSIIDGVYKVIEINEDFNFNLKRVVIEHALNEVDTILFLDTDIFVKTGADFTIMDIIADNIQTETIYAQDLVTIKELTDVYGSLDYMSDYIEKLNQYVENLYLIPEGMFILKIKDMNTKNKFIQTWKEIDLLTRKDQRMAYNLLGAMEGLIIYISLIKSNITIQFGDSKLRSFFYNIAHFGKPNKKLIKTII